MRFDTNHANNYNIGMLITLEIAELINRIFIACAVLAFIVYIPRMIYYFEGFKKVKKLSNPVKNRIAVLVPSKNEKGVVHMMNSLERQTYDHKFFDTYIIVQDKKDEAVELCKKYTNMYSKVVEDQTCKGDALGGALAEILNGRKKYAGFIVVDADNILDEDFVLEMNNALVTDSDIVLGKRCVKNYLYSKKYRNWVVNCNGLIYTFLDKLGNAYRSKHRMHASICGTGIMLSGRLVEELGGWPFRSITEDFELAISSLLNDRRIIYYEPAITYTEESLSHKSANNRRRRWLLGYAQVSGKYRKQVAAKYKESKLKLKQNLSEEERLKVKGSFMACFDFLYSFIPLGIFFGPACIAAIIFIVCGIGAGINLGFTDAATLYFAKKAGIALLSIYGVMMIYTLLGLIADRKYIKISLWEKLVVLLLNPFYIAEYAEFFFWAFYMLASGKEDDTWVLIDRIDDLAGSEGDITSISGGVSK